MKCRSKQIPLSASSYVVDSNGVERIEKENSNAGRYMLYAKPAFSLVEAVTALIILALISSSVLVVINRCMASAADSALRMQAFEVARDNMEALLSKDSVKEMVEYGSRDKYPEIQWQTAVETFYEPMTERIWVRAACSAEYADTAGDVQTIELTHWLTGLTKEQLIQMIEEKQKEKEWSAEEVIETVEEAANYAGVDVATIQQWVEDGMPKTEDGFYITVWLDLYARTDGEPTVEEREWLAKEYLELEKAEGEQDGKDQEYESEPDELEPDELEPDESEPDEPDEQEYEDLVCGVPRAEIMQMSIEELYQLLLNCEEYW